MSPRTCRRQLRYISPLYLRYISPISPLYLRAADMQAARRQFKACFTGIGQRWPEHCDKLEREVRVRG